MTQRGAEEEKSGREGVATAAAAGRGNSSISSSRRRRPRGGRTGGEPSQRPSPSYRPPQPTTPTARRRPPVSSDESRGGGEGAEGTTMQPRMHLFSRSWTGRNESEEDLRVRQSLDSATEDLVDRLFAFLSGLPDCNDNESSSIITDDNPRRGDSHGESNPHVSKGITLPAAAVGWLAIQLNSEGHHEDDDNRSGPSPKQDPLLRVPPTQPSPSGPSSPSLSSSLPSRLALLRYLLPRLEGLRITGKDDWPIPHRQFATMLNSTAAINLTTTDESDDMDGHRRPALSPFQTQLRNLMCRPLVDVRLFRNLKVLVLNQVPGDHVLNLASLTQLQVLRIENSCIYSLPQLMAVPNSERGSDHSDPTAVRSRPDDGHPSTATTMERQPSTRVVPLSPIQRPVSLNQSSMLLVPNLRRIRISNCSLTSDALIMGRLAAAQRDNNHSNEQRQGMPVIATTIRRSRCPLEKMPRLESICLSHNQLHSSHVLLRSLRTNKAWLSDLDVSHNVLGDLRNAHRCLGNLQSLNVSHNRLTTLDGIDRLLSLERLWLNDNVLPTLASVAGLARLPLLHTLHLRNNPLTVTTINGSRNEEGSNTAHSVRRRHGGTPNPQNDAAYRMYVFDLLLQRRMPILTGRTTLREVQEVLNVTLDGRRASVRELLALRTRAYVSVEVPSTTVGPPIDSAEADRGEDAGDGFVMIERNNDVPASDHSRPGTRRGRRKKSNVVRIDESDREIYAPKQPTLVFDESANSARIAVTAKFSVLDVLVHLSPTPDICEESAQLEESCNVEEDAPPETSVASSAISEVVMEGDVPAETPTPGTDTQMGEPEAATGQRGDSPDDQLDLVSASSMNDSRLGTDLDLSSISPIHHRFTEGGMKASGATTAATSTGETRNPEEVQVDTVPVDDSECIETTDPASTGPAAPLDDRPASESSNTTPIQQLSYRVPTSTSLWQDDNLSVASFSVGGAMTTFDESVAQRKYVAAEENSVFDALTYKDLNVMQNLDFYFRLFVFNYEMLPPNAASASQSIASASGFNDQNDWLGVLELYPKIQLWPIDRRMREAYADKARLAGKDEVKEEFRMVWREKVVACGKPALRRLTPSRGARFGFHGELLWSDASASHIKPETVAEPREILLCVSNTTLYFIAANDSVSSRIAGKDPFRKFPTHIPDDATFESGRWPHALGWHPFHTLTGITIGFCFQRLTLRFANATFPSPDDFTYVLLTCNKLETVRLLKEIQTLVAEAQRDATQFGGSQPEIKIDNDDRHVLDALGVAVAPDVIGMVWHYQILSQHWRHGDRGSVRRVCLVTDTTVYLLDEDYIGDGSETLEAGFHRSLGETTYRVVDSAPLSQISIVKAADSDPCTLTLSIRPTSRLARTHNWRLTCRDRHGAEQLLEDVRKAIST